MSAPNTSLRGRLVGRQRGRLPECPNFDDRNVRLLGTLDPSDEDQSGALDLALAIQSALTDGDASACIWWQGSGEDVTEYTLMEYEEPGGKYYVSKQFYRYIRPGGERVKGDLSAQDDNLFVSAFKHEDRNIFTSVLINVGTRSIEATLEGEDLPDSYSYFITDRSDRDKPNDDVTDGPVDVPPKSVVTLVSGDVYE